MNKGFILSRTAELILAGCIILLSFFIKWWFTATITTTPASDFANYYNQAKYIFENKDLVNVPIGLQGMGYPTLLGGIFLLVGSDSLLVVKWLNILLSTLTLVLLYVLLQKLFPRSVIRLAVLAVVAFLPSYVAYTNLVGTEIWMAFLLVCITLVYFSSLRAWIKFPLLGILIGIATLTKAIFLVYPVMLSAVHYLSTKKIKESIFLLTSTFIIMAMLVAPWSYRNYKVYDTFFPVSYNSGVVLYINNNAHNIQGVYMDPKAVPLTDEKLKMAIETYGGDDGAKLAKYYKEAATQWIKDNPLQFILLSAQRFKTIFLSGVPDVGYFVLGETIVAQKEAQNAENLRLYYTFMDFSNVFVIGLFLVGILASLYYVPSLLRNLFNKKKLHSLSTLLTLNTLFFIVVYIPFEGQPRYHFPILWTMVIFSGFLVNQVLVLKERASMANTKK
jgi:hypothetical protein